LEDKSAAEQIFPLREMMEKSHRGGVTLCFLFVEFKSVYNTVEISYI
jgi:hypothetical protein